MKCLLQKFFALLMVSACLMQSSLFAQVTTINAVYTPAVNSSGSAGAGSGITFSVQNTNGSAIFLRGVDYHSYIGTHNWELWYSSTSLTGNPGPITVANGWTQAVGSTAVVCATAGVIPIFSGMNTVIPANTTYRFAIVNSHTQISYGAATSVPNLFSAIGVNLLVGNFNTNTGFAGNWITPNWAFSPRFFNGNIHVEPAVPCVNPPTPGTSEASSEIVCTNDDIDLSLSGNSAGNLQTYEWQFSTDGITYTSISPVQGSELFTYAAQISGFYRCRIVCNNGAPVFSAPVFVTANSPEIYNITDTNVCGGGVFSLYADVDPGILVNWYDAQTGGNLLTTANPFQTPNIPNTAGTTTYYAEAVNSNNTCPSARVASSVTVVEAPDVDFGNNISICVDEGHVEFLDAQNPGATYLWDNNYLGRVRAVTQTGTYYVAVTNTFGCTTYDTVHIEFKPNPRSSLMNDTSVCLGQDLILDAGNDAISYYWNTGANTSMIKVAFPGLYFVQMTGANGCIKSDSVTIQHNGNKPAFTDIQIQNLGSHTFKFSALNPANVIGYEWIFGDGTPNDYSNAPTHTYTATGNYIVQLNASSTCGLVFDTSTVHIYTLGIDDVIADYAINIYPNPTSNIITIETDQDNVVEKIIVFDLLGRRVMTQLFEHKAHQRTINLSSLSDAIYQLQIETSKGTIYKKVEKIR